MTNHTFEQFQNAWISMNVKEIESCLSNNVSFIAISSDRNLTGPKPILDHIGNVFKYLKENNASISVSSKYNSKLVVQYVFDSLWPVTHYMVNSEGIYLIPCLEHCSVTLRVEISARIHKKKI